VIRQVPASLFASSAARARGVASADDSATPRFRSVVLLLVLIGGCPAAGFSPEKAAFSVRFKQEVSPYRVLGIFVSPGEVVSIQAMGLPRGSRYRSDARGGTLRVTGSGSWTWTAPLERGPHRLAIIQPDRPDSVVLNAFVTVPYNRLENGYLNGYRIGSYPSILLRQLAIYKHPTGFVEVTEENENTLVSPHFTLKDFVCKQGGGYPRYVVLKERLLLKLEVILEAVNERGYPCRTFHVMSGYRTPYYNDLIGNVKYSRHLWGGAADIFIDEDPKDDNMDDLNGDGLIDYRDAAVIYDVVDQLYGEPWYRPLVGGLARYRRTDAHGPFVHVDVRGYHARWGD
jgi:hypothetical protein